MRRTHVGIALVLASALSAQGCGSKSNVSVPELDRLQVSYSTLHSGKVTESLVRRKLGDAPISGRLKGSGKSSTYAMYAVRAWSPAGLYVPAAVLRVHFDSVGVVSDWYFLHPRTYQRLTITETLPEAESAVSHICGAEQRTPMPKLETVLQKGRSKMADVNQLTRSYRPPEGFPHPRKVPIANGETWDYHVDRPSPLFIPPFYFIIEFDAAGVASFDMVSGYGGCI
jgi:hypothetical protein